MTDDDTEESVAVCFEFGKALGTEIVQAIFDCATDIRTHALLNAIDSMDQPDAALAGVLSTFVEIIRNQHLMILRENMPESLVLH